MNYIFSILFVMLATTVFGQRYSNCYVYEYSWQDSLNKRLIVEQKFNAKGKIVFERMNSVYEQYSQFYFYDGTLLIRTENYNNKRTWIVTDYVYNSWNQNTLQKFTFYFDRPNKKAVLKRRTKRYRRKVRYHYDAHGNTIEASINERVPHVIVGSYRRAWSYDASNRMMTGCEFDAHGDSLFLDSFSYNPGGYTVIRRNFLYDQNHTDTFIYKMDSSKNIVETIAEKKYKRERVLCTFSNGLLRKEIFFEVQKNNHPFVEYLVLTKEYFYD